MDEATLFSNAALRSRSALSNKTAKTNLREFVRQTTVILLPGAGEPWVDSAWPDVVSGGFRRIPADPVDPVESSWRPRILVKTNENRTFFAKVNTKSGTNGSGKGQFGRIWPENGTAGQTGSIRTGFGA